MQRKVTHREMEVAELISFGLTEKEMSNYMEVSFHTVKIHKRNLFNKTGCRNIADVTRWYIQRTSGISIQPKEAIKKLISVFMMVLLIFAEFSTSEFIRVRLRVRASTARTVRARRLRRSQETFHFQVA